MAGTVVADTLQAASTSTLVLKNGVANTPPTIQDSAGTQIGTFCRAWVNFDGTGTFSPNPSTTKIRASFNVSSVQDNGTGDYTVNFTNAMPDVNYAVTGIASGFSSTSEDTNAMRTWARTTTSIQLRSISGNASSYVDVTAMQVAIFR